MLRALDATTNQTVITYPEARRMNRVRIGNINAVAIYITWAFLALLVLGLVGVMLKFQSLALLVTGGFAGLIVFGLAHVALTFFCSLSCLQ